MTHSSTLRGVLSNKYRHNQHRRASAYEPMMASHATVQTVVSPATRDVCMVISNPVLSSEPSHQNSADGCHLVEDKPSCLERNVAGTLYIYILCTSESTVHTCGRTLQHRATSHRHKCSHRKLVMEIMNMSSRTPRAGESPPAWGSLPIALPCRWLGIV